jgi:serine O-acetyltransferase
MLAVKQINYTFPDNSDVLFDDVMEAIPESLRRLEHCFSNINSPYFFDGKSTVFNHLHGDQYAMWLYILSNQLYNMKAATPVCEKIFLLNKKLHSCDIFYEVVLPSVFLLVHPLGTVLGRGSYSDFFVAYQRCGIGSNNGVYPVLGSHLTMRPGSSILGSSIVGDNCQVGAEAFIIDDIIPDNSLVLGTPKNHTIKENHQPNSVWRL